MVTRLFTVCTKKTRHTPKHCGGPGFEAYRHYQVVVSIRLLSTTVVKDASLGGYEGGLSSVILMRRQQIESSCQKCLLAHGGTYLIQMTQKKKLKLYNLL
jgi:hypothetical protein